jgi:5-methylcytosine-specific restriction endonuclease McrA
MRTLVLNKSYLPIKHVGWKQAFRLICKGRATVIETYEEIIRTPNDFHFVPAVIRLNTYDSVPKAKVTYSRRAVLDRDNFSCQYCGKHLTHKNATIDHVLPRSHGGKTDFENTVASCFRCNNRKGNKLNHQAGLKLYKKPKKPKSVGYKFFIGHSVSKEWADYLPRRMLDGVQIVS